MRIIFLKICLLDFIRIIFSKKEQYYYVKHSIFTSKFFIKYFLNKKKINQLTWDYNQTKDGSMLLGYKIDIYYLNDFFNYLVNYKNKFDDEYIKLNFKKKLSEFKIIESISLYELFFSLMIIQKKFDCSLFYIPQNMFYEAIKLYSQEKFPKIVIYKNYFILFFFKKILRKIRNFIKSIFEFSVSKNKFDMLNKKNKNLISLEVALNAFNPNLIFNNLNKKSFVLINKVHKLSKFDNANLIKSKKKFYPLYNQKKILFLKNFIKRKFNYNLNDSVYKEHDFINEYNKWFNFFYYSNTNVYVTNYKYSSHIIPACKAMNDLNGTSCMFQTSFYEKTKPSTVFISDIYFSFTNKYNDTENMIGSKFKYNISVGYIYDYKFELSKKNSVNIRNNILKAGAKRIVAFFDQGAVEDCRFTPGFFQTRDSYEFILNKLLDNEWLGLIIKPKKPSLLKKNLGPIFELLLKAINTGRCHVYMKNDELLSKNFENPPSEASFASDFVIHNCLVAGTAGIEGALTGKNVFYFDYFGFKESIFYKNKQKIVYNDWNFLWLELMKIIKNDHLISYETPSIFKHIDDFRDQKSFERIEFFAKNLLDGYKKNCEKSLIIENAINKYTDKWGADKVIQNF